MQIRNQEDEFDKNIKRKDEEILLLKKQLEKYTISENQEYVTIEKPKKDNYSNEFQKFKKSEYYHHFNAVITAISSRMNIHEFANAMEIAYYKSNDIIKHDKGVLYSFTEKGQQFVKYHLDQLEK